MGRKTNGMSNFDLLKEVIGRMNISYHDEGSKIIVSHTASDWDLISGLADAFGFAAGRWMQNKEPRTTIHK